jgi:oligopeptidase B
MNTPTAKRIPHTDTVHNITEPDHYFWLREKTNPEVIEYIEAENAYAKAAMAHTEALQETLYTEMLGRIKETDLSVPVRRGDFLYYSRTEQGKNYPIYCRKTLAEDAPEQLLLDCNQLAEGSEYFSLGAFSVNDQQDKLAYSIDLKGDEKYDVYIKDLHTNQNLSDTIEATAGPIVWDAASSAIFYLALDDTHRPYQIWCHTLGSDKSQDQLKLEELDGLYFMGLSRSRDKRWILGSLNSKTTSECHFLSAQTPHQAFTCLATRQKDVEYSIEPLGDDFYILSNENALNFCVYRCAQDQIQREHWALVVPHDPAIMIEGIDAFANHLVMGIRVNGYQSLRVRRIHDQHSWDIELPEEVRSVHLDSNPNFDTELIRFSYESMLSPKGVYDYNLHTHERILLKESEVLGDFDRTRYKTYRIWATADDGTQIPISLVYRKDLELNGQQPCLLQGYGSYGICYDPYFSSLRLSLLDRGLVVAVAHIRGGGEMGRQWYYDGKFLKKRNTFTDFIRCAETLIAKGYTQPEKLAIRGGSAGGLLMGAVMNMRPDLFKAVLALVPFVDVMNTMLDPSIPLTVAEYEEWGNPNETEYYQYMKSYAPYDNVQAAQYPDLLITAGLNDPRVQYWEPAKWCAKLRYLNPQHAGILMKTNMGAGHQGASGRYDAIKEAAFEFAFVLDRLGV